ncbi:MAG: adenylyltransferase [Desulfobacca sp.]|nr:adenylyltransferase [Desulfobacca sp.]
MLTSEERQRYDRQIMLKEIGAEGQERLKQAKVLVAGTGGLGSPICLYLAAAGVGTIRLVDSDTVDLSNLNRQILHGYGDIGRAKVHSAKDKLEGLNPAVKIETLEATIKEDNVDSLVETCDLIVDALDNLPTRYLLNQAAMRHQIPFFHGAVSGFEGRVMTILPGKTACLRCMFRGPIPAEKFPVIGVTPGIIGLIQATEVIKYLIGVGDLLTNRLLRYDGLALTFTEFKVKKNPSCDHCGHLAGKEKK